MTASRKTQPHRKGQRHPSMALDAMLKGAPYQLPNPQDAKRHQQHALSVMLKQWHRGRK